MRRPTPEQCAIHEASWKQYQVGAFQELPHLRTASEENPTLLAYIREQYLAACFLEDEMLRMGFSADMCERVCFDFGRACVGKSVWDTLDVVLAQLDDVLAQQGTAETTSSPQDVPAETPLLSMWWDFAKRARGDKGVYPQAFLTQRHDGGVTVNALALSGKAVMRQVVDVVRTTPLTEFAVGVDMTAHPEQGLAFDDFLAVIWYVGGKFYTGVVDYQLSTATPPEGEDEPAFRPIRWDCDFWNQRLREGNFLAALKEAVELANLRIPEA